MALPSARAAMPTWQCWHSVNGFENVDPATVPATAKDVGARWGELLERDAETDGIRVLEALAATGLRSVRYFKEVAGISEIIVNDFDAVAVDSIRQNVKDNGLDSARVRPSHADAALLMYLNRGGSGEVRQGSSFRVPGFEGVRG